jgi:hypothetical protein
VSQPAAAGKDAEMRRESWTPLILTVAPHNAALISTVAHGADAMGRPLADAHTAREIMASHRPELQDKMLGWNSYRAARHAK